MHDLKMIDKVAKNNRVWKMTDFTEFSVTLSSLLRAKGLMTVVATFV